MQFHALERLMFLEDGYRREFVLQGIPMLLLQEEGQVHLIRNQCPHRGQAFTTADVSNGRIRCPGHGWSFELASGECRLPGPGPCLTRYELDSQGNQIGVWLPD